MPDLRRFGPGEWAGLREVWRGKTWELRRGIIAEDSAEVIALFTPASTPALIAVDSPGGERLRLPPQDWQLRAAATPTDRHFLAVHPPAAEHSLLLIWNDRFELLHWYINLESDLARTETGFEYEDRFLDIVVSPDLKTWQWKDEDELAEAVERGLVTPAQAAAFRSEGELALDRLLHRRPPYDRPWETWRPPPGWLK